MTLGGRHPDLTPGPPAPVVLQVSLPALESLPALRTCPLLGGSPYRPLSSPLGAPGTVAAGPTPWNPQQNGSSAEKPRAAGKPNVPGQRLVQPPCQRVGLGGGAGRLIASNARARSVPPGFSAGEAGCHPS